MAMSQIDLENLRSNLMGDANLAKEQAGSAFATRGAPEESSFAPKAFRVGQKAFGQAELSSADDAISKLLTQYKTEANFKDQEQAMVFEMETKKKLKRLKMEVIRHAGETEKRMAKAGLDAAQRAKVLKGIEGLTDATAFHIAIGLGGPSTPVADSMKAPELGSQFETPGPSLTADTPAASPWSLQPNYGGGNG